VVSDQKKAGEARALSGHWFSDKLTAQKPKASSVSWGPFFRATDRVALCNCGNAAKRAQPWAGSIELFPHYITAAVAVTAAIPASFVAGCGRNDRNQPADSHARGITNSDQPQSRQTRMSGEGVIGG